MMAEVNCKVHGRKGIGLVCSHIAFAVDRGERVGFYWGDDIDYARPDAWCAQCERALLALKGASSVCCRRLQDILFGLLESRQTVLWRFHVVSESASPRPPLRNLPPWRESGR